VRQARGRPTSSSSATLSASIVVAEGVEEAETLATLASLGCDLAQGYYIARPTAAADLTLAQRLVP
jgi:EAL domain-containing protein (putative c-di-GMP-specific phosphodiesterase class I)